MLAPVIHLNPLTYEELLVLIEKLADIHASYFGYGRSLGTEQLVKFLQIEFGRVGAETHLTPREVALVSSGGSSGEVDKPGDRNFAEFKI